jgi:GNAT superfamily N-acetyltransferase
MALDIIPMREQHLESAAALSAGSCRVLRVSLPILPLDCEKPGTFLPLLREIVQAFSGVVAMRDGKVAGFMAGLVIPDFLGKRCAYCPEWAHAAVGSDARLLYEEMYTRLCAKWVADGCRLHAVSALASSTDALATLQASGFGTVSVDAVRDLMPIDGPSTALRIRLAAMSDSGTILKMGDELTHHLAAPPVFWPHEEPDYVLWLRQPKRTMWLAQDRNRCLGLLGMVPDNPDGSLILRDDKTVSISIAFTSERARRTGIATGLLNQALQWARTQGYERCAVNLRLANYSGARYFLKRFRPATYSLLRWIPGNS